MQHCIHVCTCHNNTIYMRGILYRRSLDLAWLVSLWCGPKARSSCVSWSCSSVYRALLALPHSMSLFSAVRSVRPTSTLESPPKGKRVPHRNATGRSGTRVITNNRQAQPLCELSSGNDGWHTLQPHYQFTSITHFPHFTVTIVGSHPSYANELQHQQHYNFIQHLNQQKPSILYISCWLRVNFYLFTLHILTVMVIMV